MSDEKHLDNRRNDANDTAQTVVSENGPNPETVARLVVREGKSFYYSALAGGYAETIARRGLKAWLLDSKRCNEAFRRETDKVSAKLDTLKPHAVNRLFYEITDFENGSNGLRAIEIAGKFKETDWFVRSSELNLGMFVSLTDESPDESIDKLKE